MKKGTVSQAVIDAARRRGQTGFLKPRRCWRIEYDGESHSVGFVKKEADRAFKRFCKWSAAGQGKAAGKTINLFCDGRLVESFVPATKENAL